MQESRAPKVLSRREWWRSIARLGSLAGLGLSAVWLGARNGTNGTAACPRGLACGGCPIAARCALPERIPLRDKERSHE